MEKIDRTALEMLALVQLIPEKIDDLSASEKYGSLFRFRMKKKANEFIHECDRVIDLVSDYKQQDINELMLELSKRVSTSVDELMNEV